MHKPQFKKKILATYVFDIVSPDYTVPELTVGLAGVNKLGNLYVGKNCPSDQMEISRTQPKLVEYFLSNYNDIYFRML